LKFDPKKAAKSRGMYLSWVVKENSGEVTFELGESFISAIDNRGFREDI
jgi:hypothetical protein